MGINQTIPAAPSTFELRQRTPGEYIAATDVLVLRGDTYTVEGTCLVGQIVTAGPWAIYEQPVEVSRG